MGSRDLIPAAEEPSDTGYTNDPRILLALDREPRILAEAGALG